MPTAENLSGDEELVRSPVVANRAMNRTRLLTGRDGYERVLGFDIRAHRPRRWLDLCCGSGRALLEAASVLDAEIVGIDLVGFFAAPVPANVTLIETAIADWTPDGEFDLITCVHGLHYIGDKLGTLLRAASWLSEDGVLVANFDTNDVRRPDGQPIGPRLTKALRQAGFDYRNKRIRATGPITAELPWQYLGADLTAGPNYTGQPAVHSYYRSNQGDQG